MKINRTTIIFVLFIMNIIGPITAQEFSVEILPLSKQLPSNSVQRVFQDREGGLVLVKAYPAMMAIGS